MKEISALIVVDRDRAKSKMREAHLTANRNVRKACKLLGISSRLWYLYLDRIGDPSFYDEMTSIGRRPDRDSVVYFIRRADGTGPIKVGTTSIGAERRLAALQAATPERLEVLAICPGDEQEEGRIMARFGSNRLKGEWFHPVPELLEMISVFQGVYKELRTDDKSPTNSGPPGAN